MLINQIKSWFERQADYITSTSAGAHSTAQFNLSVVCPRPRIVYGIAWEIPCDHIFFYEHALEESCKPQQSALVSIRIDSSAFLQTLEARLTVPPSASVGWKPFQCLYPA